MTDDSNENKAAEAPQTGSNSTPSVERKKDYFSAGRDNAKLVYILYFVTLIPTVLGLVGIPTAGFLGLAGIIGVIFALMNKGAADEMVASHYEFQFHTFWKGLLIGILAFLLMFVMVGILIYVGLFVWWGIRTYKGMELLDQGKAHPNPHTWGID